MKENVIQLRKQVEKGIFRYQNKRLFGGAGIVISDEPLAEDLPEYTVVISSYAHKISSVIYSLKDICDSELDYMSKYTFYGRLARAANKYQQNHGDDEEIVIAVLDEGYRIASEINTVVRSRTMEPKYPRIYRRDFPLVLKRFGDYGHLDIAWGEGLFPDGRPFRAELWLEDQVIIITIFLSVEGIEHCSSGEVLALLKEEGVVTLEEKSYTEVRQFTDSQDNTFFSVNVVLSDEYNFYGNCYYPLKRYTEQAIR